LLCFRSGSIAFVAFRRGLFWCETGAAACWLTATIIKADAGMVVADRPRHSRGDGYGVRARIEHDEVVAQPMHLAEF